LCILAVGRYEEAAVILDVWVLSVVLWRRLDASCQTNRRLYVSEPSS